MVRDADADVDGRGGGDGDGRDATVVAGCDEPLKPRFADNLDWPPVGV